MDYNMWTFIDDGTRYAKKEKGKVTLELRGAAVDSKSWSNGCIRVPITSVIPQEQRVSAMREGRKLKVTGVNVRLSCAVLDGTSVSVDLFLRESEGSLSGGFDNLSLGTGLEKPEGSSETSLPALGGVRVVRQHGPLRMTEGGRLSALHGEDGKGPRRMQNWFCNEYLRVNNDPSCRYGGQDGLALERSVDVLLYVYPSLAGVKGFDAAEGESSLQADLRNAIVDIYYVSS